MANTPDVTTCVDTHGGAGGLLPLSPFYALSYHFGMLLGVDDFETEQAYHRGKHRLHNAWLHREGVVWGFNVTVNDQPGEIRVTPGLALDAAGHELHLEADACLNVGKWFDKHEKDPDFEVRTPADGKKVFDAHVVIRFKPCLTRQVPALMEPCNNGGTGTAYSRVFETVEILLLPGPAPAKRPPYHLLRLLFGLEAAETAEGGAVKQADQDVLDALAAVEALPAGERPAGLMAAFHRFAALDEINLKPARSEDDERTLLFPGRDDEALVLANLASLTLTKNGDAWVLSDGAVDTSVRPSHVATTTIQDLLCGARFAAPGAESAEPARPAEPVKPAEPAADGPQIDPASVTFLTEKAIMFSIDKALQGSSVRPAAFSVTWFDAATGWQTSEVVNATYTGAETHTILLDLESELGGRVRLIAYGTGPTPVLGADLFPLAGAVGGPAGTLHDGHDFVHMKDFVKPEVVIDQNPDEAAGGDVKATDEGHPEAPGVDAQAGETRAETGAAAREKAPRTRSRNSRIATHQKGS